MTHNVLWTENKILNADERKTKLIQMDGIRTCNNLKQAFCQTNNMPDLLPCEGINIKMPMVKVMALSHRCEVWT